MDPKKRSPVLPINSNPPKTQQIKSGSSLSYFFRSELADITQVTPRVVGFDGEAGSQGLEMSL